MKKRIYVRTLQVLPERCYMSLFLGAELKAVNFPEELFRSGYLESAGWLEEIQGNGLNGGIQFKNLNFIKHINHVKRFNFSCGVVL